MAPKLFLSLALPDNFKGRHGFGGEQHDASEFARIFLDKIERDLKLSPKLENINKRYLEGQKVRKIQCLTCQSISERKEAFIDLDVNFNRE